MPVILPSLPDPSPPLIAGEQLRQQAIDPDQATGNPAVMGGAVLVNPLASVIQDEDALPPMNSYCEVGRLGARRMKNGVLQQRANAGISTPCGAWISNDWSPLLIGRVGGYERLTLTGVSRDSTGAALGGCTVKVFSTINDVKLFETVSNGSGSWSIDVGANPGPFYFVEYKAGTPDLAGTSLNTNVPTKSN